MEYYIPISLINDYLYSPESIYLHLVYQDFDTTLYKDTPQINGVINHAKVDNAQYSKSKHILQGTNIFCDKYGICGKLDTFDTKKGLLRERKSKIKQIHLGYIYQLYAQMFCLIEMGYTVKALQIYSMEDNKVYIIDLPNVKQILEFEEIINQIKNFDPIQVLSKMQNDHNAQISIYKNLAF
jgi:CRISPR-associated exonuclease Cas4